MTTSNEQSEARYLISQAMALLARATGLLDPDAFDPSAPIVSEREHDRVSRLGEVAHLHLALLETADGPVTLGQSIAIRRRIYGGKVRSTANLFGKNGAQSTEILYREVRPGTRSKDNQIVHLSAEGLRLARLWRQLHERPP